MTFEAIGRTDAGLKRDENEDSIQVVRADSGDIVALADGMGGHRGGAVASDTALSTFTTTVQSALSTGSPVEAALRDGIQAAHNTVEERAEEHPEYEGMGTTLVGAVVTGGTVTIANVGDSRAYHVTARDIEQVTTDQSLVTELIAEGILDKEQAADHPHRHVLSQAIGTTDHLKPDIDRFELEGTLLLCSDGLTEEVSDAEIHDIVTTARPLSAVADRLIQRANDNGGSDNISVVLGRRR